MNEFAEMIREALLGEESRPPDPDREALEASLRKLERRDRTVRGMALSMVGFATAVFVWGLVRLLGLDADAGAAESVLWGSLFLGGLCGVSFGKMWYAMMLNHHALMKELKRAQIRTLEV